MAALGLPLHGTPDYVSGPRQALQYMQPDAFSVEPGYGQPAYPAMYPMAPGNLPEYLNTAPSAALQWEMPQVLLAPRTEKFSAHATNPTALLLCSAYSVCVLSQSYFARAQPKMPH